MSWPCGLSAAKVNSDRRRSDTSVPLLQILLIPLNQSTPDLNRSVPDVEADEPTWATVGEPGVASYAAFNLDMFDLECPRARISPFVSYAEAAAFVRVNFWFNGVDYWDGEQWVLDVRGEVLLLGGPAQKQRLRELAAELARADSALRRAALLLGREDLAGDARGVGPRLSETANVVGDAVVRLRAAAGVPLG